MLLFWVLIVNLMRMASYQRTSSRVNFLTYFRSCNITAWYGYLLVLMKPLFTIYVPTIIYHYLPFIYQPLFTIIYHLYTNHYLPFIYQPLFTIIYHLCTNHYLPLFTIYVPIIIYYLCTNHYLHYGGSIGSWKFEQLQNSNPKNSR